MRFLVEPYLHGSICACTCRRRGWRGWSATSGGAPLSPLFRMRISSPPFSQPFSQSIVRKMSDSHGWWSDSHHPGMHGNVKNLPCMCVPMTYQSLWQTTGAAGMERRLNGGSGAGGAFISSVKTPPCTLHPPPSTLHPTPYTLHPTPYDLHPTPYALHPTPYTLHPTPYFLHPSPYTLHPTP